VQAARLGLNVGSIGHVGSDVYGRYMDRVLQQEGIHSVMRIMPPEMQGTPLDETLLCFVLVDPQGRCAAAVHCRAAVLQDSWHFVCEMPVLAACSCSKLVHHTATV
jgi:sugar/nucleoside kinase (ribokinase family)